MRILFLTHYFDPEPIINGLQFAKELARLGHDVEVLTGFPHYPGGKVYPGYKIKLFQRETMDGIPVMRTPVYPSHDNSARHRILTYSSFGLSAAVIAPWVIKRPDVAFVYQPPPTTCLPAFVIKLLYRVPFVYNIQDLWPEAIMATRLLNMKTAYWLAGQYSKLCYKAASVIVPHSPGIKDILCQRGVPENKIQPMYNWALETNFDHAKADPALAEELGFAGRFNILFAGAMGEPQALHEVINAAAIVQDKCPKIQFVFIGAGLEVDNLKQQAKNMRLTNVRFLKRRPQSEIGAVLAMADVLLVHLSDTVLHETTIPSKTQAFLARGKPIMMASRGDAADLVLKARAGLQCIPENPKSIAETAQKFFAMPTNALAQMGEHGKTFYNEHLALAVGAKKYVEIFKQISHRSK